MMVIGLIEKAKEGGWEAAFPVVAIYTQGETKKETLAMVKDAFESLADGAFEVAVSEAKDGHLVVESNRPSEFIPFILRRLRTASGKSLAEAAEALGHSSRNAYARYEQGASSPTVEKLVELLAAVAPDAVLTIGERKRR